MKETWIPLDLIVPTKSLDKSGTKKRKAEINYDEGPEVFRDVADYDVPQPPDDSKKDISMEPELFRNAISDYSASLDTPSRLPWHSHAGSTGKICFF